jgi:hypothetical protein
LHQALIADTTVLPLVEKETKGSSDKEQQPMRYASSLEQKQKHDTS